MRHSAHFIIFLLSFLMLSSLVIAQSEESNRDICRQYFDFQPEKAKASSTLPGYPASNAIDKDPSTNWFGDPQDIFPKWIQFDLGSNRCINSADLAFFFRDSPLTFQLEVSNDGKSWNNLSDEVKLEEGQDLAKIGFFPKIGRYVRFLQTSSNREYGSLREISLDSSALRSTEGNKISLIILDKNGEKSLKDVSVKIKEESIIIESRKTSQTGRVSFSDLSSNAHTIEILCPVNKSSSTNLLFSTFLSSVKSYLSIIKTTGYSSYQVNSGYGVICSGETFIDDLLCGETILDPIIDYPKINDSIFSDPLIFCGDYKLGYPEKAKASSTLPGYPASNAIDNNFSTNWFGSTEENYPKWIQFDLGERQCIKGAELSVNSLDVPMNLYLQVSDDGQSWRDISSQFSISDDFPYSISFDETQARYFKVVENSAERDFGSLSDIKLNKAKLVSEATIIQSKEGIVEREVNPPIILVTKDLSASKSLSGIEAVVFNNETDSYGKHETDSEGHALFVNALSKDTNIRVYCES